MILRLCVTLACLAGPVAGQTLSFPSNAEMTDTLTEPLASYDLPMGPWADGVLPAARYEGQLTRQAWRVSAPGLSTLQLLRPLREQIRNAGLTVVFECEGADCGGFDFRFATPVMLPPAMQVDIADFRFLSATDNTRAVGIMVSRTEQAGFVQVTWIGDAPEGTVLAAPTAPLALTTGGTSSPLGDLPTALEQDGRFVLQGLDFASGSAQLVDGDVPVLAQLAAYLAQNPNRTVALVGHTDSAGSLDGNIALSRQRAGAVVERLVGSYGVPRRQLDAQGMGYLSPLASNLTEDGRASNRRVEVIITSTAP